VEKDISSQPQWRIAMLNSVRIRLTLWYLFVFGSLLIGFSFFVYTAFSKSLYDRLDHSLSSNLRATATEFQSEIKECQGDATQGALETLKELQIPGVYTAFFEGERLLVSNYPDGRSPSAPITPLLNRKGETVFQTIDEFEKAGARLAVTSVSLDEREFFVSIAEPLADLKEQLESVRRIFYLGLPATLLVAGIGGFLLAKKNLSPVVGMSNQAKRISATNLQERLQVNNPKDELGQLAQVFNELLSRLQHSFENMREFMADASHELRTPLAIIRGEADVVLSKDREDGEYKESLAIIQDEAKRLSRIVDDMLALARADAGQHSLKVQEFYLNDLVEEVCRSMQVLATRKQVSLNLQPTADLTFCGDEDMIRRLILNLLDNAVKYTPSGGSITVKIERNASVVTITISDTGVGIPAEAMPHVFERFYRVDKARSRSDGGSGLGLAIAKWVAEAHNGSIEVVSQPGQGSTFRVMLRE
jgi:heavy metal sensor kinase